VRGSSDDAPRPAVRGVEPAAGAPGGAAANARDGAGSEVVGGLGVASAFHGASVATAPPVSPPARAGMLVAALRASGRVLLAAPRGVGVLLALGWMAFNHWLSSGTRGPDEAAPIYAFVSNLAHAPLFGLLALWWLVALPRRHVPFRWADLSRRHAVAVWLAVVVWGVLDELHQSTVAGRDASFWDLVTDGVGAAAVLVVVAEVGRSEASTRSVAARLALGVVACAAAALAATFF
jgi:VanZ family protein